MRGGGGERDDTAPVTDSSRRSRTTVDTPSILVVNKTDAAGSDSVFDHLAIAADELGEFDAYVPLSALTGDGVDALVEELETRLPEGPQYFPDGMVTDQPETFLAAELVREQLLQVAREELPHSIAVTVEEMEDDPARPPRDDLLRLAVTIRVERDSQKGIVIGRAARCSRRRARTPAGSSRRCSAPASTWRRACVSTATGSDVRRPSIASDSTVPEGADDGENPLRPQVAPPRGPPVRVPRGPRGDARDPVRGADERRARAGSGGGIEDMTNRSRRRKLLLAAVGLAILAFVVAGCGPDNGQNSLQPKGTEAEKIDNLFWPVLIVAVLVGIFIFVAVLYCAIRFRRRAGNERPKQIHGNTALEIGWTLIPAVILAVIAVPTVSLIFQLNEDPAPNALEGHGRRQAVVVAVRLPRDQGQHQGRHRQRDARPHRS